MDRIVVALLSLAAPALALAEPGGWVLDEAHSQTSFEVVHLGISWYRGEFTRTTGTVTLDEEQPAASRVEATVDAGSVRTREPAWDARLRSPEFLDVARYPVVTFRSTAVVRAKVEVRGRDDELGQYRVKGLLTLHGVTRPVVLEVTVSPAVRDADGRLRRGLQARATINRQDFGIRWSGALEAGPLISDEVGIRIDAEAVAAEARAPSPAAFVP